MEVKIMDEQDVLLIPQEAAAMLRYEIQTLANRRFKGLGPKYIKLPPNGHIRYRLADLKAFIEENSIQPDEG